MAKKVQKKKCRCRPPKRHHDCMFCGMGGWGGEVICGVCKENGIDGPVIRGTSRFKCKACKCKTTTK